MTMRTGAQRRSWDGPAFLSRGFRPFFLAAALWAVVGIAIWPAFFTGDVAIPTAFSPVDWHAHEMIFGYAAAVITGFLLTAIPNWTGRLPVVGWPLAVLATLWMAGRAAVLSSEKTGWLLAAVIDGAFLFAVAATAAREVVAGRNLRNLKVVMLIATLAVANLAFHIEAAVTGAALFSTRVGLAAIVLLILVVGGRIVPSFTHNWLARTGVPARPVPFGPPDIAVMMLSAAALILWVAVPAWSLAGGLLILAGVANLWRLSRWQGWRALPDRLVLVLHVGFLFAALGFLFAGAAALIPDAVPQSAAIHVWAIGGIGMMTLAVMTRVTLGHTGRALDASPVTQLIYLMVVVAVVARVTAAFLPETMIPLIHIAAVAWSASFVGLVVIYGPMLLNPAASG